MKTELAPVTKWQKNAQKVHNLVAEKRKKKHWGVPAPQPMALAVWQLTHENSANGTPWQWGITHPEPARLKQIFAALSPIVKGDVGQSSAQRGTLSSPKRNPGDNRLAAHFSHFIQQVVLAHEAPVLARAQDWLHSAIVEDSITHRESLPLSLSDLLKTSQTVQWWDALNHEPGQRKMVIAHAMLVSDFFQQRAENLPANRQWTEPDVCRGSKAWCELERAWTQYFHRWAADYVLNRSERAAEVSTS